MVTSFIFTFMLESVRGKIFAILLFLKVYSGLFSYIANLGILHRISFGT